jgi:hypothetical protein
MFRFVVLSLSTALVLLGAVLSGTHVNAATGDPFAIQRWPGEELTIETLSGLRILIQSETGERLTDQDADITLLPGEICDHHLYRKANEEYPIWQRSSAGQQLPSNSVTAQSIRLCPVDKTTVLLIEVDGVSILIVPPRWVDGETAYASEDVVSADLLILPSSDPDNLSSPSIQSLVAALKPQTILLSGLESSDDFFADVAATIYPKAELRTVDHNTLAVCHQKDYQKSKPSVVRLSSNVWQMPEELDERFTAMELASDYSQRVLTQLSTNRMNFKPSNGTHTPRWNAEHMTGRQLGFFSQIYHAVDPMIPVMDFNPKQMPEDYVPANPSWDGAEEARRMKQVSQYCRRFAYLLDEIDLDDKPPAVRWPTLRALVDQMENHFQEHTANVVKKFDLPDWPAEEPAAHATAPPISKPVLVP